LVALKITDVVVGGNTYDVSFAGGATDQTFFGNINGALAATHAINNQLNASTAAFVSSTSGSVNQFSVRTDNSSGGITGTSYSSPGNWQVFGLGYSGTTAQFVAVVPEPSAYWMAAAGCGLIGLALTRRNKSA
jgi:hypothetical protein